MLRIIVLAVAAAALALPLGGCKNLISGGITAAGQAAPTIPNQVATVGDAVRAATLVTKATQAYVDNAKLTRAQLQQISAYSDALHAAVDQLESDNAKGVALNFAAVNAALAAWNTYSANLPSN